MPDEDDLVIVPDVPTATDPRSSVLTLEMPMLPPIKKGLVNLEGELQEMLAYVHRADASLAVLEVAKQLLTQSRAVAMTRGKAIEEYQRAVLPDDSDAPIPF